MPPTRVLAVNIAAGNVYGAVVACPDVLEPQAMERLQLAEGLDAAHQLADFAARFRQELRQLAPVAVGVVNTRLYANWKYADAFKRISIEAAIMLAVVEASTPAAPMQYVLVKQEPMAKALKIPLSKLVVIGTERWGDNVPRYRKDRLPAVAAAFWLAQEHCP